MPKKIKIGQTVPKLWTKKCFSRAKCRHYGKIRIFVKLPPGPFYDPPSPLTSCRKIKNSNERIFRKGKKPLFLGRFGRIWACPGPKKFLSKIRLRHFSIFTMTNHHSKNQKNPMNGFWDFCVTDGRTYGRKPLNS